MGINHILGRRVAYGSILLYSRGKERHWAFQIIVLHLAGPREFTIALYYSIIVLSIIFRAR